MKTSALPTSVSMFREALGLAFELDDLSPGQTFSLHLSPTGAVENVVAISEIYSPQTIERLLSRPASRWLLITSLDVPLGPVLRSDTLWFSFLSSIAQVRFQTLVDWIVVDGEDARSFAYLTSPETAWIDDPAEVRRHDYINMAAS